MNGPEDTQLHDLGWMAAPAWLLFSAMEILGFVIEQPVAQNGYIHHLIEVSPGLLAAAIGVLHWWSTNEFRKAKLANDLRIAELQSKTQKGAPND